MAADYTRSTDTAKTGSYSIKQSSASAYANFLFDDPGIPVIPGEWYIISFWSKITINSGNAPIFRVTHTNKYGDSDINNGVTLYEATIDASGSFVKNTVRLQIPDGIRAIFLRIFNNGGNVLAYYDDFSVVRDFNYTQQSEQRYLNETLGYAPTEKSVQGAMCSYLGIVPTSGNSVQRILNRCLGRPETDLSEQEALFEILKTRFALTGARTQYSTQYLHALMNKEGITPDMLPILAFGTSLVGFWSGKDSSNATEYLQGDDPSELKAVFSGAPSVQQTGKFGKSFLLDGVDDALNFKGLSFPLSGFTVGFLIKKVVDGDANDRVFDLGDSGPSGGFNLNYGGTNNKVLNFTGYNATSPTFLISTGDLTLGQWYLVIASFETNNAALYLDGALIGTDSSCSISTPSVATVTFGRRSVSSANFTNAYFQNVFILNRVITSDEVKKLARMYGYL